jgi:putative spermidine/putrescine transport system permease protein
MESRVKNTKAYDLERTPLLLKLAAWAVLLFMHIPVLIILLYAFTTDEATYNFPPPSLTTKWFGLALQRPDLWRALLLSLRVAGLTTMIALVLGTLAAAAVYRTKFFGRESISFLLVLPLALRVSLRDCLCALRLVWQTFPQLSNDRGRS